MSDDDACGEGECPDCIDCNASLRMDYDREWPSIGPICYTCLDDRRESLAAEVASVLVQLDEVAEQWGDEAQFRRCRDRLRAAINTRP